MSNYIKKAAAHARLLKLASAARLIRRQRALQKYAQAVQMQKAALDIDLSGHKVGVGAGIGALGGGLLGAGLGYGLGAKDKKLMSTLLGAGIGTAGGAGLGALGGYWASRGGKAESLPVEGSGGPGELTALRGVVGGSGDPNEVMPVVANPVFPGVDASPEDLAAYYQAKMQNLQALHFNTMNDHRRAVAALGDPLSYTPEAQKKLRDLNDAYSTHLDSYNQGMNQLRAGAKMHGVMDKLN